MPRWLVFTLLVAVAAVAAPVPKKPVKDYQKLADETEWQSVDFVFKATLATDTTGKSGEIDTVVSQAKAFHASGDDKQCIEVTTKTLQDLQNSNKGGK